MTLEGGLIAMVLCCSVNEDWIWSSSELKHTCTQTYQHTHARKYSIFWGEFPGNTGIWIPRRENLAFCHAKYYRSCCCCCWRGLLPSVVDCCVTATVIFEDMNWKQLVVVIPVSRIPLSVCFNVFVVCCLLACWYVCKGIHNYNIQHNFFL